eukprot:2167180-Pyramimonas_sp.AAC.1
MTASEDGSTASKGVTAGGSGEATGVNSPATGVNSPAAGLTSQAAAGEVDTVQFPLRGDRLSVWARDGTRAAVSVSGLPAGDQGIFRVDGVLLVAHREYSQSLAFCWSHIGNILSCWRSIGRTQGIFR